MIQANFGQATGKCSDLVRGGAFLADFFEICLEAPVGIKVLRLVLEAGALRP
jgi:hypothetical protein